MPAPIPEDVRRRALDAYDRDVGTVAEIATIFSVGAASIGRWLRLRRETGGLAPRACGGSVSKIPPDKIELFVRLVDDNRDAFNGELAELYEAETGVEVSAASISRALKRAGITRKKNASRHRAGRRAR
jgi:transposase